MCPAVVKSVERESRGREPAFAGSDPDPHAAEPDPAGADHGEQRPVPRRAAAIHVLLHTYIHAFLPSFLFIF